MSFWRSGSSAREALAQVTALGKSQAVIEFNLDGTIITANQNFLDAVGYRLDEIKGNHHSMFVVPEERSSPAYREFWAQSRPRRKSVRRIQATRQGRPRDLHPGVLQSDYRRGRHTGEGRQVRDRYHRAQNFVASRMPATSAYRCAQAMIEFNLDGTIITANENFLGTVGYRLDEIQGQHHKMFVAAGERDSAAYREFWASWAAANSSPASTSASARAPERSGSSPPTIRSSTTPASRSRW